MKHILVILVFLIATIVISSCEKDNKPPIPDTDITDPADGESHENPGDYAWGVSSELIITLEGSSISSSSPGVSIEGSIAIIQEAGNYKINGQLNNGQIIVDTDSTSLVRLILNNAVINNSSGPAILIEKSRKTIINLVNGTSNAIADGSSNSNPDPEVNAALYSKSDMTIFGGGSLTVNGNYNDGITGKDGVIIASGNLIVTAVDDGIIGKDYLIIKNGNINVKAAGDGLKSDNEDNSKVGYILIDGGQINAETAGDGIYAVNTLTTTGGSFNLKTGGGYTNIASTVSAEGFKGLEKVSLSLENCIIDAADHAIHSDNAIEIHSGNFDISTSKAGVHSDSLIQVNSGKITIVTAMEGFESHNITFNDGNLNISSIDDCFSATAGFDVEYSDNSTISIKGGEIIMTSLNGDALDSNGSVSMTDGTLIIHGPIDGPDAAIDYNATFNIYRGLIVASGPRSEMTQALSSTSFQNSVLVMFPSLISETTLFHIQDENGTSLVTFQPSKQYQSIIFSSPALVTGNTYYIYSSGSTTGIDNNGLFDGGEYTPGNQVSSFGISSKTTTITIL